VKVVSAFPFLGTERERYTHTSYLLAIKIGVVTQATKQAAIFESEVSPSRKCQKNA
jgi:hypothetical protein